MFRIKKFRVIIGFLLAIILFFSMPQYFEAVSGRGYSLFIAPKGSTFTSPHIYHESVLDSLCFYQESALDSLYFYHVSAASGTETQKLTASSFAKSMKVGWNLGNSLDSHYQEPTGDANLSQETIWGQPRITQEQIDYVRSLGFDTIRIPVSWYYHTYTDENGQLRVHPDWLNRVKEVVGYCLANDMCVIMDSHHDGKIFHAGVDSSEFEKIKRDVTSIWSDIATYFADADTRVMFEAFNEPDNYEKYWQFGKKAASQINELNQLFVNVVRSTGGYNSERILVVPTLLDGNGEDFLNAFVLPKDSVSDRLIATVHFYPQFFDQGIEPTLARLESFSKRIGAPVIIGEWGTKTGYAPASYRSVHAGNYVARVKAHGLNCIYWDNGSDFAIIDRKKLTCNQAIVDALMNPQAYTSSDGDTFSDWEDFLYMTVNQNNGALKEDRHWGSIVLSPGGEGLVPIPEGSSAISLQLLCYGDMSTQAYHYVYFFDAQNGLVDKINSWDGFTDKIISIPEGAVNVRIGINSAKQKTKKKEYQEAIKKQTLIPIVKFY